MDEEFGEALAALQSSDVVELERLLHSDPSLAVRRSSRSHPTLLQALALETPPADKQEEMAGLLIQSGAEIDGPLLAAASVDNVEMLSFLLQAGGAVDSDGGWSPLEEALCWGNAAARDLLLERGARIPNLRAAAGLGRVDLLPSFFRDDGTLADNAGKTVWPFGGLEPSNRPADIDGELKAKVRSWTHSDQEVMDNAFVYACMGGYSETARFLLERGARVNAIPAGFDFAGSGLHYAALRGHAEMVEVLLSHGADRHLRDSKVQATPAGWAEHGGHPALAKRLAVVE